MQHYLIIEGNKVVCLIPAFKSYNLSNNQYQPDPILSLIC
jgi:hypothetical protein